MAWIVTVSDPETRRAEIEGKAEKSAKRQICHEMSQAIELPVIRLDIKTPVYRMANIRTRSRQRDRVRRHTKPSDWFQTGQENIEQQSVQHEILVELAKRGSGETVEPVHGALAKERVQKSPILITRDGVVVNGNRRLSAMRDLYGFEAAEYPSFAQVEAMVLPADIDLREIRRIEVRLQMAPQTLLPYDWADAADGVREMLADGFDKAEVAGMMRLKESEIDRLLNQLAEADLYLEECAGQAGDYLAVLHAEQHFKEMAKALQGKKGDSKQLARRIGQAVLKNQKSYKTRIYDYRILFGENLDMAVPMLADRLGVAARLGHDNDDGDMFGGGEDAMRQWKDLAPVLLRDDKQTDVAAAIKDVAEIIIDQKAAASVYDVVKRLRGQLEAVNVSAAAPDTFSGILHEVGLIDEKVAGIRASIAKRTEALAEPA